MAVSSKHPMYSLMMEDWVEMRDTYMGERKVKEEGEKYLPATSGMRMDGTSPGQAGYNAYLAYITRASYPDTVRPAVHAMVGVMHHKPPVIELPARLERMREHATVHGRSSADIMVNPWKCCFGISTKSS